MYICKPPNEMNEWKIFLNPTSLQTAHLRRSPRAWILVGRTTDLGSKDPTDPPCGGGLPQNTKPALQFGDSKMGQAKISILNHTNICIYIHDICIYIYDMYIYLSPFVRQPLSPSHLLQKFTPFRNRIRWAMAPNGPRDARPSRTKGISMTALKPSQAAQFRTKEILQTWIFGPQLRFWLFSFFSAETIHKNSTKKTHANYI